MNILFPAHIHMWPTERLVPYVRNARKHSATQIDQIAASIREFGFTNPILVDGDSGIIAGHARLAAALKLSLAEVPVIVLEHLTDLQKRAYILADSKLAENACWSEELLDIELQALMAEGFDIPLIGFSDDELEALQAQVEADPLIEENSAPALEEIAITRPGDLWLLGSHRLLCGDATQSSAYDRLLQGGGASMVFTDPPYNVNYEANSRPIANDNLGAAFAGFLSETCSRLLAVCNGALYICMSSSELATLQQAFTDAGGHWSTWVIGSKHTFTLGRSDYQRQYEPILYGWKEGSSHYWCGDRDQSDVWQIPKPAVNDLHPTTKPIELVERAIRNSSRRGEVVLDAFGGSGSTLIAAEKLGRRARRIELKPRYGDVIIRRWQKFAGAVAVLEEDGRPFATVASERSGSATRCHVPLLALTPD